jgi:hypothetical protein
LDADDRLLLLSWPLDMLAAAGFCVVPAEISTSISISISISILTLISISILILRVGELPVARSTTGTADEVLI